MKQDAAPRRRPANRVQLAMNGLSALLAAAAVGVVIGYDALLPNVSYVTTAIVWLAFALAVAALYANRPDRRSGWYEAAVSIAALATGDTLTLLVVGEQTTEFLPANICFMLAYGCGGVAMWRILKQWSPWHQWSALIDALTMLVGVSTVIASVVWLYTQGRPWPSGLTLVLFPMLDLLLIGVVGRYWFSPGGRVRAVQILCGAILVLVVAHLAMLLRAVDPTLHPRWTQLWLLSFVGIASAVVHPSSRESDSDAPQDQPSFTRLQVISLMLSVALPSAVLLGFGLAGRPLPWIQVGIGGMASAVLVGLRLTMLVKAVETKTLRIDLLARSDSLTGVANRRHWDQVVGQVLAEGRPSWVLILDLDHFKVFNDSHGHLAGDEVLRESVRAWRAVLPPDTLLARYGGEEFTILLNGLPRGQVHDIADALRAAMPRHQTCSIGIAHSGSRTSQDAVLRDADLALYAAKRAGRDRTVFFADLDPALDTSEQGETAR